MPLQSLSDSRHAALAWPGIVQLNLKIPERRCKMKCFILFLLGIHAVLLPVAQGAYRIFDNFEDETVGMIGGQDNWYSSNHSNLITLDPNDGNNQVLSVPSESSVIRKSLLTSDTIVPDGTIRMLFMRIRISQKQTFSVGLSALSSAYEFSDFGPEIGMAKSSPANNLRVWDNEGGNYELLTQLAPDRWYNLWVLIDTSANEYQIWLNDIPGTDADPADQLRAGDGDESFIFRSGHNSDLVTFFIKTAGGISEENSGPVYMDDIYLELGGAVNLTNPILSDEPIAGDADMNGCVDFHDYSLLAGSWNLNVPDCSWQQGDFNYDGFVDLSDINLLAESWLRGCGLD